MDVGLIVAGRDWGRGGRGKGRGMDRGKRNGKRSILSPYCRVFPPPWRQAGEYIYVVRVYLLGLRNLLSCHRHSRAHCRSSGAWARSDCLMTGWQAGWPWPWGRDVILKSAVRPCPLPRAISLLIRTPLPINRKAYTILVQYCLFFAVYIYIL